jgi:hypothetical protein
MVSGQQTLRLGVRATALMSTSFLLHPRLHPPPQAVAYNVARAVGIAPERLPWLVRNTYWIAAHFAFGTSLAAARQLLPAPRSGVVYGLSVWLLTYGAALPAARIYPAPRRDHALRVASGVIAHAIFGASLRRRAERAS